MTHELCDLNIHHTIKDGIFLQPTIAELYHNDSTRFSALFLITHELGHASCPWGSNRNMTLKVLARFFLLSYGQAEWTHINNEIR